MSAVLSLALAPDLDEIDRLSDAVRDFAEDRLSDDVLDTLELIIDELLTNTIRYGFADGRPGGVRVRLSHQDEDDARAILEIEDDGVAFDPLLRPPPDLNASLEDRQIGGWGLHLVRQMTDRLVYEHRGGMNYLRAEILCDQDPFAAFAAEEDEDEEDGDDGDDAPKQPPPPPNAAEITSNDVDALDRPDDHAK